MCWMKLNIFYLEESLVRLSEKFGNVSSNKENISIFIQILQEQRVHMQDLVSSLFTGYLLPLLLQIQHP